MAERFAAGYRPPRFHYRELPTVVKLDYFLILDFEANLMPDQGGRVPEIDFKEIIEFPVLKVNARTFETESEFHFYVQPTISPRIIPFITELTGITQDMVDGKPTLPEVLKKFDTWMNDEGLLKPGLKFCFVTSGDWDLKTCLPANCDCLQIDYKEYLKRWINIKSYFRSIMGKRRGDRVSMPSMLDELNLSLDGRHHSGIDDCRNIAKIVQALASRSERLRDGVIEPRLLILAS